MTLGQSGADRPADPPDASSGDLSGAPTAPSTVPTSAPTSAPTSTGTVPETPAGDAGGRRRRRGRRPRLTFMQELPFLVVAALVLAIVIKAFVVQAFYIPSGSMEKTLHGCEGCHGDRVMVNKLSYDFHGIRRGDIVVFNGKDNYPGRVAVSTNIGGNPVTRALHRVADWVGLAPEGTDYIKRVIGLPGDTVACCTGGHVTVKPKGSTQAKALDEPYVYIDMPGYDMSFKPVVVPAGHIFVMGDHRNDSYDSRAAQVGSIPEKDVIGRAFVIIWPPSRWRWLGTPSTFHHLSAAAGSATPLVLSSWVVFGAWGIRRTRRRRAGRGTRPGDRAP